jgi:hypothetical protein
MAPPARWAWNAGGALFLALGAVGAVLPLLPTTPFLLLSAACFLRGSPSMHRWMLENRVFGAYLRRYREGLGIPVRTRVLSIAVLWMTLGLSAWLAVESWWVRLGLAAIGLAVSVHIARIGRRGPRPQG